MLIPADAYSIGVEARMILTEPVIPGPVICGEAELVQRARGGDSNAMNELAQRHRQPAYWLALQLLGNREDALDVAQDAMLRFFSTLHRFDTRRPVRPWLFQIVRNRVQDLRRRARVRRHESLDAVSDDGLKLEIVDTDVDPERDASRAQLRRRIWQNLGALSDAQREILVLRDYQDLSYAAIAATLKIPIGTVMSRLHGARKRLGQFLDEDLRPGNH